MGDGLADVGRSYADVGAGYVEVLVVGTGGGTGDGVEHAVVAPTTSSPVAATPSKRVLFMPHQ